ncbi:hypothetical protein KCU65_g9546, partial [Aureobasidium melanogenum]
MEPPPGIVFAHELEWVCKEPALVIWNDPDRPEISSLGLPCPNGKPTLLTLWVGKNAAKETYLMLHLRITIRVSKRRKILDHYLLPSSGTRMTASTSVVHLKDASEDVRQCLEEAYGKFSTQKCLRIPFLQPKSGRALMPVSPDKAPCLGGTALHLMTLLHSLSRANSFEMFVGYSSYGQHALANIEGVLADSTNIDLLQSYGGHGASIDPAADLPPTRSVRSEPISCSPTFIETSVFAHDTEKLSSLEQIVYSPTIVNTPSTVEDTHTLSPGHTTPNDHKTTQIEADDSFAGHLLSNRRDTSPSTLSTPGRSDTLSIKPTVFTNGNAPPRYSTDTNKVFPQAHHQALAKVASSFMSTSGSLDMTSPEKPTMRSLNKELRMLVSAKIPLLTEQALQRIINDILESLEYSQKAAEIGLQETSDDLKVELQLEKDKGLEEIDDHAENTLDDVKCLMEDLASGHLLAFEDMLQRTGEQLKQSLKAFLVVLAKAVATDKHDDTDDRTANIDESNATQPREQHSSAPSNMRTPNVIPPGLADSPAVAATKLFLHEFGDLCTSAKVKVLDRLASQNTAEIFLIVDKELREAWVASWTSQVQS